jgi:CYTH domain-containing protein
MPSIPLLRSATDVRVKDILQTYLVSENGKNSRLRKVCENGKISYIKTVKERISTLSAYEDEKEISEEQYNEELKNADTSKNAIVKTRYCIPYADHIIEIDIYPFWSDRAILEVELSDESESFSLPEYVSVVKEVSDDKRYKNTKLAESVPFDEI